MTDLELYARGYLAALASLTANQWSPENGGTMADEHAREFVKRARRFEAEQRKTDPPPDPCDKDGDPSCARG